MSKMSQDCSVVQIYQTCQICTASDLHLSECLCYGLRWWGLLWGWMCPPLWPWNLYMSAIHMRALNSNAIDPNANQKIQKTRTGLLWRLRDFPFFCTGEPGLHTALLLIESETNYFFFFAPAVSIFLKLVHQQVIVVDCLSSSFNTDRNTFAGMMSVELAQHAPKHRGCTVADVKVMTERYFSAECLVWFGLLPKDTGFDSQCLQNAC